MTRLRTVVAALVVAALAIGATGVAAAGQAAADAALPPLTEPVNDVAGVIDASSRAEIDRMARALMAASGDVVIVATVKTFAPHGSIQEYAVELFENQGRGIGGKGKDNGLLVLLAVDDRKVWIEVGYGLEGFITDGFAGETSRQYMAPYFRSGEYGQGLRAGIARLIARIAEGRNISLDNVRAPDPPRAASRNRPARIPFGVYVFLAILVFQLIRGAFSGGPRRRRGRWGDGGWSGWSGGVGPFGGGGGNWGGGFGGGGGGGGGFGGFGGGRSGGGGGGASW